MTRPDASRRGRLRAPPHGRGRRAPGDLAAALVLALALGGTAALPACTEMQERGAERPAGAPAGTELATDPRGPTGDRESGRIPMTGDDDARMTAERDVTRGTGVFLGRARPQARAYREPSGDITLNFVNADVAEVVRAVLGGILNLNFAIDPAVKGMMTLQTSRPIPRPAVLPALENALAVNGIAIVASPELYRVVPVAKAAQQGAPLSISGAARDTRAGFGVRIVPLKYVSAAEMEKILAPLASQGTIVRVDAARNLLILAAPRQELEALEETIAVFDVDWLAGLSLAVLPLEFVDPETLVKEIDAILGEDPASPLKGVLRFVPLKRLNAVLAISTQPEYLARAEALVEKLDKGGAERQLFVYYVQNSDAEEIAGTLSSLFGGGPAAARDRRDLRDTLAPQLEPARVPIREYAPGPQGQLPPGAAPVQAGAAEAAAEARRPSSTMAQRRPTPPASAAALTIGDSEDIRIVADRANNAILVWASPADYRMVRSVLERLDTVPLQVLIEATIAEVTLNESLRYGLQWFFRSGESSLTLSGGETGTIAPTFPGFSYFLNGADVKIILDALESVTDLNIISSPQLMVLDNQTAMLQVGDQVPILIQQSQSTIDPDAPIVNSIQYRDTGIILRVTPRVNAGGLVSMTIEQEASQVSDTTTTEGISSPTFQQRLISSTVAVQSGDTVVLGGLIQDTRDQSESGVPILRSIPGLGFLFGAKSDTKRRTELLVLITPRAVRNQQEVRSVTEELRKRLRALSPLGEKIQ